jgi:tripartite-type tricarboxylate transporter receptor subunit TctC
MVHIRSGHGARLKRATATASVQYVTAGKLKVLAVTTASCPEVLPDVPAVAEFVAGYEATT